VKKGFKQGDVFAIYLPNVPEYPIIFYGVGFIGGISTPDSQPTLHSRGTGKATE